MVALTVVDFLVVVRPVTVVVVSVTLTVMVPFGFGLRPELAVPDRTPADDNVSPCGRETFAHCSVAA